MNAVVLKRGIPGYECGECDAVFVEPVEVRTGAWSEAHGAEEYREWIALHCPTCDSTDLESVHVCAQCRELPANDGPHCGVCAPVADCDVCSKRPGTHSCIAYGIETWVCDPCGGREPDKCEHGIAVDCPTCAAMAAAEGADFHRDQVGETRLLLSKEVV